MKACIKATGEIVEVEFTERKTHTDEDVYITQEGCLIEESRLDFNVETIDYWTRLEHTYAGMAMQGLMTILPNIGGIEGRTPKDEIVDIATDIAHALVEKLKEKEERK